MIYFLQYHRHDSVIEFTLNDSTDLLRPRGGGGCPRGKLPQVLLVLGAVAIVFLDAIAIEHLYLHYLS